MPYVSKDNLTYYHNKMKTLLAGKSNTNHTHNYAGSPSPGGGANTLYIPRITTTDANYQPGSNCIQAKEFGDDCTNIPSAHWYHILTGQGNDADYNTQLALGMTTQYMYYRYRNQGGWQPWKKIAFTDSDITGNAATSTRSTYSSYPSLVASNEIRFDVSTKPSSALDVHIGFAWSDGSKDAKINNYIFCNGTGALAGVYASNFNGNLSGNAATATKLATARTINGTSFDGSANITTSNWGTARTITIGSTGKSVNGSGNISWSLSEIGAASSSHTHDVMTNSEIDALF